MKRIAVVGAGVAGVAAAFAIRERGCRVTVFGGRAGASRMTSGAVHDAWEPKGAAPLSPEVQAFVQALDVWRFGGELARLATRAGVIRPARGADRSLLDLGSLAQLGPCLVGVPRVARGGWDAAWLAAGLGAEPWAERAGVRFAPIDLDVLRYDDERAMPDADLAARHDQPARLEWLSARIREARARSPFQALLLGPWLGLQSAAAPRLSEGSGVVVGEVLSPPDGPAGARLAGALGRVLAQLGAETVSEEVTIEHAASGFLMRPGAGTARERFDAVVVAVGGVSAGGIVFEPPDPRSMGRGAATFRAPAYPSAEVSWAGDGALGRAGLPAPSLAALEATVLLERAGLMHEKGRVLGTSGQSVAGLWVAGDAAHGPPRTLLSAVLTGLDAGAGAAQRSA